MDGWNEISHRMLNSAVHVCDIDAQSLPDRHRSGPDSANGRASASGAGGRGFDPGPRHTKGVKYGTSGYLAWRSAI